MDWLRKHQRKILGFVIFGFIVSTFVGFGLYIRSGASHMDTAAEVNDEKISYNHFSTLYNQVVNRKRDNNETLSPETLKQLKSEVVQALVQEAVFFQEAEKYGFHVSDQELAQNLANVPAFQKDGKFSPQAYVSMLQSVIRSTPQEFEESQRRQLSINHLRAFVMQGIKITDRELEMELAIRQARMDPKKKNPPLEPEKVRVEMANEKGAQVMNRWYQHLGSNVKLKVYLDEIEKRG